MLLGCDVLLTVFVSLLLT